MGTKTSACNIHRPTGQQNIKKIIEHLLGTQEAYWLPEQVRAHGLSSRCHQRIIAAKQQGAPVARTARGTGNECRAGGTHIMTDP